jgi:hypothetical protein
MIKHLLGPSPLLYPTRCEIPGDPKKRQPTWPPVHTIFANLGHPAST